MSSTTVSATRPISLDAGINPLAQGNFTSTPTANFQAATATAPAPQTLAAPPAHLEQTATTAQTLAAPPAHIEPTATTANLQAAPPINFSSTENTTTNSPTATTPQTFIKTLTQDVATAPNDAQALTREGQQILTNSFNILLANNKANILNLLGTNSIAELKNQIQIPEALDKLINGILNNPQLQQELQGARAQEFKEGIVNYLANHLTQNQINQALTESSLSSNDTAQAWLKQFFEQVNVEAEQPALLFSIADQVSELKPIAKALVENFQQILANTANSMPERTTIDVRPGVDTLSAIQQQSKLDEQGATQVGQAIFEQSVSLGKFMQKTVTQHLPAISKLISTATNFFQNIIRKSS